MKIQNVLNKILFLILIGIKISYQTKRIFGGMKAEKRKIIQERNHLKSVHIDQTKEFKGIEILYKLSEGFSSFSQTVTVGN